MTMFIKKFHEIKMNNQYFKHKNQITSALCTK